MKLVLILLLACLSLIGGAQQDLDRFIYPLAKPHRAPRISVDVSDLPAAKPWMDRAAMLVHDWYPTVTSLLATEHWRGPRTIKLVVKKTLEVPAYTAGDVMTINGEWITKHPDDFGMVIHELTHVVQSYPESDKTPGWLVEGIADYIRWYRYEPDAPRPRVDKVKSKYTDSYRVTAAFLAWVGQHYDMRLVPALDRAMRAKLDPVPEFKRLTGKDVDALWTEFVGSLP
jgi:hypothetical protein